MAMIWSGYTVTEAEADLLRASPEEGWATVLGESDATVPTRAVLDLDQAWQGILPLLNPMNPGPLLWALVEGGNQIGLSDGVIPPRLLDPATVASIGAALDDLTLEEAEAAFASPEKVEEFVAIMGADNLEWDYIGPYLQNLKTFYRDAAKANASVLYWAG